jgi:hypothetical protein
MSERPKFIKPEEQSTLMGYPTPGNSAVKTRLEREYERVREATVRELVDAGRLKIIDLHGILIDDIRRKTHPNIGS